jgi:hypothetical protein
MTRHLRAAWLPALLALVLFWPAHADAPIQDNLYRCAVPFMIYPHPDTFEPWQAWDEHGIAQWDEFASVMDWKDNPAAADIYDVGNGRTEMIGFITDAEMYQRLGWHWGNGAAVTLVYGSGHCIVESDIAFNADLDYWTADPWDALANPNSTLFYQHALLHELGHTLGLADYDYSTDEDPPNVGYNSIMNYAGPWEYATLGIDDTLAVASLYPSRERDQVRDIGIYPFHCTSKTKCPKARLSKSSAAIGDTIQVTDLQIANLGPNDVQNVVAKFSLLNATDHHTTYPIGSVTWTMVAARANALFDADITIPEGPPTGEYYVQVEVSHDRSDGDLTYPYNDVAVLPATISIFGAGDEDNIGPEDYLCQEIVAAIYDGCGLVVGGGSESYSQSEAELMCYGNNGPWGCVADCWEQVYFEEGCGVFEKCLKNGCGLPLIGDDTDEKKDDSGCGG